MAQKRSRNYYNGLTLDESGRINDNFQPDIVLSPQANYRRLGKRYWVIKRAFDIASSICLVALIWPIFVLLAIAIKLDSKGPAIYRHKRIGQGGKAFYLYKFRSMVMNADELIERFTPEQREEWAKNYKLENDPRVTRVGRFLRRSSLDELPQLFNIIKGDLSVVGPRPVIESELERYGTNKERFLSFPPGLTGYWQAYARSNCTYEQRMQMELYYVDNASFLWDMKIIWTTAIAVSKGKGAV